MKKQLYAALVYHQRILDEKYIRQSRVTIGPNGSCDFMVDVPEITENFLIFDQNKLCLRPKMLASMSIGGQITLIGEKRNAKVSPDGLESYEFGENDWIILNLSRGLDFVLCYKSAEIAPYAANSPFLTLTKALESPIARTLVLSFALHSAFLFIASMYAEPESESLNILSRDPRWVELISEVEEHQEQEKEELPVIEDVDNVIIDDSMKDLDRPKIDDTQSPLANLDKVEKPVGLQAALGGAKLHDMQSLFGSSAGLGDALDFMPETAEGDAFGTGAGFGAGLSGIGVAGGGGGGGGYGSGIGGIGGGGGGTGGGSAKVGGPKKSGVKQKPKLAMDAPKQGAFCKESNIRDVVQKRSNALRNCYEQQLLANPELSGKIIVFWKIGLDGKVMDASIKSTTMNNARVESCLTQTVRRLRFDKPDGGICVVEFPFIFTAN
ncbi:MAG: AgmX/PglI C-terminal domain-containing protein [Proteobacteria bacterium]|nr:AgmX/PglI C-terminal domain-containing protein [Pseudomonadota bacterium]